MTAQPARGSASLPLLVVAALVVLGGLSWVLFSGVEPAGPLPDTPSASASLAEGPSPAELGALPTQGPPPRSSVLVKATLTVLLSTPGWATLPEVTEVTLSPTGDTPGDEQLARTRIGGASVEFHDLLFGSYELRVRALGFADAVVPVQVSKQNHAPRRVIPLLPAREITGQVRDAGGRPIVGVEVSARPIDPIPHFAQDTAVATTDEEGIFHITPVPEGNYWLHAGPLRSPISDTVRVELVGERAHADIEVGPLAQVAFEVIDEHTQAVVPGARVQILRMANAEERGHSQYRIANAEGIAQFAHLPPGEYAVTFIASGYKTETSRYRVQENADGRIRVPILPLQQ